MTYSTYRPTFEDVTELLHPTKSYQEGDPRTQYWLKDGVVHFHDRAVEGAASTSFRFFLSGVAADSKHCYFNARLMRSLDSASLREHSFAYHGDKNGIRTLTAELKGADVATFAALDSGIRTIPGGVFPYILIASGYAKDKNRAYFCDGGNAMPVVKADPASFEAIADSFAADDRFVFWGRASLPKVKRHSWRRLAGAFSTDGVLVYSCNRIIDGADPETFTVYPDKLDMFCYARDKHSYYGGSERVSRAEVERRVGDA
ncbi:MAG: DKNYY domain-containing protein [Pseudomonadota bacterium]